MEAKKRKAEETVDRAPDSAVPEEDVAELAEHLSKEQLVSIVKQAALSHTDVLSKLRKLADQDPAARKLFVRGLSWSTDGDSLKKAFEEYGAVKEAVVVVEKSTGKSRGFGFITFKHRDAAIRALKEPSKNIEGRKTICYLSGAREADTAAAVASAPPLLQVSTETAAASRKIYVGNLPKSMQKGTLLGFFSQFGEIEEGPLGFDRKSGKCKGFALLVYKSHESVRKCLKEPSKTIDGHKVQCKLAESQKSKDEGVKLGSSTMGYDLTNPALIASHNPSFLQSSTQSLGQSLISTAGLSSFHGMDPLRSHSSSLLAPDSAYASSSMAAMYGLPHSNHGYLSSSHPSLTSMHDAQVLGYSSLARNSFY
eukprot:c33145_g1_i1 orf=393-1493(-)